MNKILVTRSSMPSMEEYIEEIKSIWDSHWLTNMGEKHEELTKQLEEYLGVERASLFSNGHMALELGLQAMNRSYYYTFHVRFNNACHSSKWYETSFL